MIPVTVEIDLFDDGGGSATLEKDMLFHCLPRIGDEVQVHEHLDASKVRRVLFCADGSICVALHVMKSFKVETLVENLVSLGFVQTE